MTFCQMVIYIICVIVFIWIIFTKKANPIEEYTYPDGIVNPMPSDSITPPIIIKKHNPSILKEGF